MWAAAQGIVLNVVNQQGEVQPHEADWIHVALSFLQDEAAIWTFPAMKEFAQGVAPFSSQWRMFRTEFKACFKMVNETVDTKEKL